MKKTILIILFLTGQLITAQAQKHSSQLQWFTDFEKAKAVAKKEHKPILMLFTGSDWCPPCRMMHNELFEDENFIETAKNVVLVLVDFPRRKPMSALQRMQNSALNRKFHGGGVPTFVAVTPDEKILGKKSGYRPGFQSAYIDFFNAMIDKYKK